MYVRTKKGKIFDCIESEQMNMPIYYPKNSKTNGFIDYNEVYKKSNNIIEILEVGDYVNGRIVDDYIYLDKLGLIGLTELEKEDEKFIKSIVTKEQFSSMEYRINE